MFCFVLVVFKLKTIILLWKIMYFKVSTFKTRAVIQFILSIGVIWVVSGQDLI